MGHDKETREKLIESAKAEFMEKGYNKASLRSICANAGVTTGALYFFFDDKADLFKEVTGGVFEGVLSILQQHFDNDRQILSDPDYVGDDNDDHSELAQQLIHYIYSNYDEVILMLKRSQGSEYEDAVDRIVDMTETASFEMMVNMASRIGKKGVNKYMLHLVTHLMVDSFVHLITHEPDEQKALQSIKKVFKMTTHNWTDTVLD